MKPKIIHSKYLFDSSYLRRYKTIQTLKLFKDVSCLKICSQLSSLGQIDTKAHTEQSRQSAKKLTRTLTGASKKRG